MKRDEAIRYLRLLAYPRESLVDVIARVTRGHGIMCPCTSCKSARAA